MIEAEKSCGNIYRDLGFEDADEMQLKAELTMTIDSLIEAKNLTRMQAADIIGMPMTELAGLLNGQFRDISVAKMMEAISRLGRDVQIVIGPEIMEGHRAQGHIEVVRH